MVSVDSLLRSVLVIGLLGAPISGGAEPRAKRGEAVRAGDIPCELELRNFEPFTVSRVSDVLATPTVMIRTKTHDAPDKLVLEINGASVPLAALGALVSSTPSQTSTQIKNFVVLRDFWSSPYLREGLNELRFSVECNGRSETKSTTFTFDSTPPAILIKGERLVVSDARHVTATQDPFKRDDFAPESPLRPTGINQFDLTKADKTLPITISDEFGNTASLRFDPAEDQWQLIPEIKVAAPPSESQVLPLASNSRADNPSTQRSISASRSFPCVIEVNFKVPYFEFSSDPQVWRRNREAAEAEVASLHRIISTANEFLGNFTESQGYPRLTLSANITLLPLSINYSGMGYPTLDWRGTVRGVYSPALKRYTTEARSNSFALISSYKAPDKVEAWLFDQVWLPQWFGAAQPTLGTLTIASSQNVKAIYENYISGMAFEGLEPLDEDEFLRKTAGAIVAHELLHLLGLDHISSGNECFLMKHNTGGRYGECIGNLSWGPVEQAKTAIAHLCGTEASANFKDLYGDRFINLDATEEVEKCGNGLVGSGQLPLEECEPENTADGARCLDDTTPLPLLAANKVCNPQTCRCITTIDQDAPVGGSPPGDNGYGDYGGEGPTPDACGGKAPACSGSCPPEESCQDNFGTCECVPDWRPVPCGSGPDIAPLCIGVCPNQGEQCLYRAGRCSCYSDAIGPSPL